MKHPNKKVERKNRHRALLLIKHPGMSKAFKNYIRNVSKPK